MQTLHAARSHATMADVYATAIYAMETTIAMTTVMKMDAVSHLLYSRHCYIFNLFISLQTVATLMSSVVTMVDVFLTAIHVMAIMTVEITVMKTDVVCHNYYGVYRSF